MGHVQHQVGQRRAREVAAPQVEPEVAVHALARIHHPQVEAQLETLGDGAGDVRVDAPGAASFSLEKGTLSP